MTATRMADETITQYDVVALRKIAYAYDELKEAQRIVDSHAGRLGTGTYSYHVADLLTASRKFDTLVSIAQDTGLAVRIGAGLWKQVTTGRHMTISDFEEAGISVWCRD